MAAAVSIGIGGMVGAGIFSILGVVAQAAGNAMWLAFAIGGVVALLSTYSYAKLGATFPSAGGAVHFLVKSFRRRRAGRRAQSVHVGRLHHLARALRLGFRQLCGDLLHHHAVAAAAEVARGRLGASSHHRQCVRRQDDGPLGDLHRRRQGRDPGAVCGGRAVLHQARQPLAGAMARDPVGAVRRRRAVHRLRRLRAGHQRRRRHAQPARHAAARALHQRHPGDHHLSRGLADGERQPVGRADRAGEGLRAGRGRQAVPRRVRLPADRHCGVVLDRLGDQRHALRLGQRLLHDRPRRRTAARSFAHRMEAGDRRTDPDGVAGGAGDVAVRSVGHRHDGQRGLPPGLRRGECRAPAGARADRREPPDRLAVAADLPGDVRDPERLHLPAAARGAGRAGRHCGGVVAAEWGYRKWTGRTLKDHP